MRKFKGLVKRTAATGLAAVLFISSLPAAALADETELTSEGSQAVIELDVPEGDRSAIVIEEEGASDGDLLDSEHGDDLLDRTDEVTTVYEDADPSLGEGSGRYLAPKWERKLPAIDPSLSPAKAQAMLDENKGTKNGTDPSGRDEIGRDGAVSMTDANDLPSAYPLADINGSGLEAKLEELIPTRDQGRYGTCWAHAATYLSESYKSGRNSAPLNPADSVDYSERHLSYYTYHNGTNPYYEQPGDSVRFEDNNENQVEERIALGQGGNFEDAAETLSRWRGAADESIAPYPEGTSAFSSVEWTGDDSVEMQDEVHLTDAYFINIGTENGRKHAKNWIREHGSIGISFNTGGSGLQGDNGGNFYDPVNNSFYNYNKEDTNHAVAVVGWNDDFDKDLFTNSAHVKPSNNGAWLIRNSWSRPGNSRYRTLSYQRYFWLSYEDKSISPVAYAYVLRDASEDAYRHNLYYDSQTGSTGWYTPGGVSPLSSANVFTIPTEKSQKLKEISFKVAPSSNFTATTATAEIYKLASADSDPTSGTKVSEITDINIPYPGIYTIPLPKDVVLNRGESFSVVIKLENGLSLAMERGYTINIYNQYGQLLYRIMEKAGLNEHESYMKNGMIWSDLKYDTGHTSGGYGNFIIHAITEDLSSQEVPDLSDAKVTLANDSYIYNGTAREPEVLSVVLGGVSLEKDIDYTVNYSSNVNAGTGTVTIKAKPGSKKCTGSQNIEFSIQALDLSLVGLTLNPSSYTYTGYKCSPAVSAFTYQGTTFTLPASDYTVSYGTNVNAGTGSVTVSAKGSNCIRSKTATFTIGKIDYTGLKTETGTVYGGQVNKNVTITLPSLPAEAVYSSTGTVGGSTPALITGTPSINGGVLTFSTSAMPAGTSATIAVNVTNAANYNNYQVLVTVTAIPKENAGILINYGSDKKVTYGDPDFEIVKSVASPGTNGVWKWTSSDTGVAAIDERTGYVLIRKAGTTRITGRYESDSTIDEKSITLTVNKAGHDNESVLRELKPGLDSQVELASYIASGASYRITSVTDPVSILSSNPAMSGTGLTYGFKAGAQYGSLATVTIEVKDASNYLDYSITVTLKVTDCSHEHTELRNEKSPNCIEKGYTGDIYCTDCGSIVESGTDIPTEPDDHDYDDGVVTTPPTVTSEGVKTYTCRRCHHTYTEPVSRIAGGGDDPSGGDDPTDGDDPVEVDPGDYIGDLTDEELDGRVKVVRPEPKEDGTTETDVVVGGEIIEKTVTDGESQITTETQIWIDGLNSVYRYTGAAIKPAIRVYDGTKKLKAGSDYSVAFKGNKAVGSGATMTITFKGNYKGTPQEKLNFNISPAILGEDVIAEDMAIAATGKLKKPAPVLKWKSSGKTVNIKNFSFSYADESGNKIEGIKEAGTYTVTVIPKNGSFMGRIDAAVTVTGKKLLLSGARVTLKQKKYTYTGGDIIPESGTYTLKLNGEVLTEDADYEVISVKNNKNPGTATITFGAKEGNGEGYVGTKTATFKIVKGRVLKYQDDEGSEFTYSYDESLPYAKGGARPAVTVSDGETVLVLNKDYTVSYSKNTKVTDGATAVMTVKGKGNYKGSVKLFYEIYARDIGDLYLAGRINVADKVASKKGHKNPTVTIVDFDGKKLKERTDFTVDADPDNEGPDENGMVNAVIYGKGKYTGSATVSYRYIKASAQLSKAKTMTTISSKTYTGKEIELEDPDLTGILHVGSKKSPVFLEPGVDFEVAGYSDNIKTGNAKVTLKGIGSYGGTRTLIFKIKQKKGDYKGALIDGVWQ